MRIKPLKTTPKSDLLSIAMCVKPSKTMLKTICLYNYYRTTAYWPQTLQVLSVAPSTVLDHKSLTPVLLHDGHTPRQPAVFFMPLPLFGFAIFIRLLFVKLNYRSEQSICYFKAVCQARVFCVLNHKLDPQAQKR